MTVKDFCNQQNIAPATFGKWQRRIKLGTLDATQLGRDPADRSLYLFSNKGRNKLKLLIWHLNGYSLLYKRLEKQRFHWPDWYNEDTVTLTQEQLDQLLDGYNLNGMRRHQSLSFAHFA